MAQKVTFVTGGCRSGKSRYALDCADLQFVEKIYLATAEPLDEEMARRIEHHKKVRGPDWKTIEEPIEIAQKIMQIGTESGVVLLDCVTLWISNLLMKWDQDDKVLTEIEKLLLAVETSRLSFVIVSNEVGMGIVPADPLSRRFRDLSGIANQKLARAADTVVCMISGIPLFLKGHP